MRNTTHVYESSQPCEDQGNYFLCETQTLTPGNDCINRLIRGQHSNCTFEKVYSKGLIKRINDASILINNAIVTISSNCSNTNQQLNGSFLIQFEECSLQINGEFFSNFETVIPGRPYHTTTGLLATEIDTLDAPPAEYLQHLTLKNREQLETISLQNNSLTWKLNLFGSLGGVTFISIIAIIGIFLYNSRKPIIKAEFKVPDINRENITLEEIQTPVNRKDETIITNPELTTTELSEQRKTEIQSFINMPSPFRTIQL